MIRVVGWTRTTESTPAIRHDAVERIFIEHLGHSSRSHWHSPIVPQICILRFHTLHLISCRTHVYVNLVLLHRKYNGQLIKVSIFEKLSHLNCAHKAIIKLYDNKSALIFFLSLYFLNRYHNKWLRYCKSRMACKLTWRQRITLIGIFIRARGNEILSCYRCYTFKNSSFFHIVVLFLNMFINWIGAGRKRGVSGIRVNLRSF